MLDAKTKMAKHKKQHYVPRSYLKFFAFDTAKKLINLYNFDRDTIISNINLKDQCYEKYYYGKNSKNEERLSKIEDAAAETIKKIVTCEEIPQKSSQGHLALMLFVLLQVARTPSAERDAETSFTNLIKQLLIYGNPQHKSEIEKAHIKMSNTPSLNIASATRSLFLLFDLEYKIFKKALPEGFITSEHPAIRYNLLYESQKSHLTKTGFATRGLQIFLPLSSNYCLIFYDASSYKIGERKQKIIEIKDSKSLDSINGLQFVNAPQNIYFDNNISLSYVKILSKKYISLRKRKKLTLKKCPQGFYLHETSKKFRLSIAGMKILKKAEEAIKFSGIRNPELLKLNKMIFEQIDKRKK